MKCPLRRYPDGNFGECYEEECAWWTEFEGGGLGECSVIRIANSIKDINEKGVECLMNES